MSHTRFSLDAVVLASVRFVAAVVRSRSLSEVAAAVEAHDPIVGSNAYTALNTPYRDWGLSLVNYVPGDDS